MGSSRAIKEQFYRPLGQDVRASMNLVVLTSGDPLASAMNVRDVVAGIDPNLPISNVATMAGAIESATWLFGVFGTLFTILGGVALFMSAVGLYGVMAFSVTRRIPEMGIRMALGASGRAIVQLVFKKGCLQLGMGMLIGLVLGAAMSQPLSAIMFDVSPSDVSVYLAVSATLTLAGMLACVVPARRATRIGLTKALRLA